MPTPERCNCGAEDCPRCYPLNRKQAEVTESHRELAIEQAVETLMDHGQYPDKGRKQLYLAAMSMHTYLFKERVEKERKAVTALLWLWLKDTDLINELAQDIANEDE